MALTAPSSTLTGQTIASSYDQLLFLDDASGVTEATLKIVSGTTGKTALQLSDEHVLIKGVDTSNAAAFEVQQTGGTSIFKIAADTPVATLIGDLTVGVNDTGHDVKFFGASSGAFALYDQSEDTLEIRGATADAAGSSGKLKLTTAQVSVEDGDILGRIDFASPLETQGSDAILSGAAIWAEADATFTASVNSTELVFATNTSAAATERMRIDSAGNVGIGVATPSALLEVRDGAFALSDTDFAHSLTSLVPAKQWFRVEPISGTNGGATIYGVGESDDQPLKIAGLFGTNDPTNTTPAIILHGARLDTGTTNPADLTANETVLRVDNNSTTGLMTIRGDGDMGLGTATPSSKLHVVGTVQVGEDDAGHDVIFYGNSASSNMTWDTSEDDLVLNDSRLYINQDDDAVAIQIDSESAGQYAIDLNAKYGQRIVQDISSGTGLFVTRDIAEAGSNPLVLITDNHTSNTQPALKIQQDGLAGDAIQIDYNGTTGNVIDISTPTSTTGTLLKIQNANALTSASIAELHSDSASTTARSLLYVANDNAAAVATIPLRIQQDSTEPVTIDHNLTATTTDTATSLFIDFDATGITASGQTATNIGLDLDMNSNSPTMVGTVNNTGIDLDMVAGTSGTQTNTGINIAVSGADTNYPLVATGGNCGIGVGAPPDLLSVGGSDTAAKIRLIDTSDDGKYSTIHLDAGSLVLSADEGTGAGSSYMGFKIDNSEKMRIDVNGAAYIGDSANANMTVGLTINQGAADNQIFALKSSDVAHARTTEAETDTFFKINKRASTYGGVQLSAFGEDTGESMNFQINSHGGAADTTKSTSARGLVEIEASQHDGADGYADIAANGNVFNIIARVGGGGRSIFMVDEDGDIYSDGGTSTDAVTVWDEYDDSQLIRTLDLSRDNVEGLVKTKFDEFIGYNDEKLAELGIVGREKDGTPNQYLNVTGLQRLHNGAIWQQYTEMQKMKELMYDTMVELIGKEKADQKLKDHDVKLLDENTLLN